jgi:hypothetical protein
MDWNPGSSRTSRSSPGDDPLCSVLRERFSGRAGLVRIRDRPDAKTVGSAPGQYSGGIGLGRLPLRVVVAGSPIAWWSFWTVALRVILVWLYNNTGRSVFATALFHTTINVTWQLFPIQGSFFDPRVTGPITAFVAAAILVLGPGRLSPLRVFSWPVRG